MLSSPWPRRGRAALFQYSGAGVLALIGVLGGKVQLAPGHPHSLGAAALTISTPEVSAIILVVRAVLDCCLSGREVGEQSYPPLRVLADSEHAIAAIDRTQRALGQRFSHSMRQNGGGHGQKQGARRSLHSLPLAARLRSPRVVRDSGCRLHFLRTPSKAVRCSNPCVENSAR